MRLFLGLVQRCGLSRYSTHSIITLSRIVIGILLDFHFIFNWFLGKRKNSTASLEAWKNWNWNYMYIANIVRVFCWKNSTVFLRVSLDVSKFVAGKYIFSGSLRKFTSGITLLKATSGEERALGTSSSRVTENNCVCDVTMTWNF